jgi:NADH-quinone oxidoreductase subunit N
MNLATINIAAILPSLVLSIFGIVVMVTEPFVSASKKIALAWVALAGTIAAMFALIPMAANRGQWYSNLWIVDDYDVFLSFVFLLIAAITILTSADYLRRENMNHPEFYALLLFATAGMLMMAASNELVMVFLGLEILSIATYIMAGFRRTDLKSNESALKYFLLGSFSSAFFLYGVALIFGATGSTNLIGIAAALRSSQVPLSLVELSAALILIALCFKVAVAPFHIWTPDVYEGAPTPVTGFMSVGPKAAGFAVMFRVFLTAFPMIQERWASAIYLIAALTMVLGNVIAVVQPNIKRMLAYSSIAHAGYVAVALATVSDRGVSAALFYLLAYSLMNLGAFAIVTMLGRSEDKLVNLSDFAGLAAKRPGLAALLSVFLLSLAGRTRYRGFCGKFFHLSRRSGIATGLACYYRRGYDRGVVLLLPLRHRSDVYAGTGR